MVTRSYFTLYETAVLSLCGALVFLSKAFITLSLHLPGHSYLFVAIPFVVGCGVVRKAGSGTYIGLVGGLLSSFSALKPSTSSTSSSTWQWA